MISITFRRKFIGSGGGRTYEFTCRGGSLKNGRGSNYDGGGGMALGRNHDFIFIAFETGHIQNCKSKMAHTIILFIAMNKPNYASKYKRWFNLPVFN